MSEYPVVVIDIGSASVKAGWAGDDVPSVIFPSVAAKCPTNIESIEATNFDDGPSSSTGEYSGSESIHPVQRGVIRDWEKLEILLERIFGDLGISVSESGPSLKTDAVSVMIAESSRSSPADRVRLADILFRMRVPSMSIGNSSSLSIFAAGRTTGVAVECGAGLISSVPVFEGLALSHAAIPMLYGGQDISANLRRLLGERGIHIDMTVARYLKERMAYITPTDQVSESEEMKTFGLPDGSEVTVDNKIFSECCSSLFQSTNPVNNGGLGYQVFESISLCDDSIRRDMSNNIIIAGGTSLIPGLGDRLNWEVNSRLPAYLESKGMPVYDARVLPSRFAREPGYTHQRKIAPWIGGSIIGSLDTYKDIKLTKQEYEESADAAVHAKCF